MKMGKSRSNGVSDEQIVESYKLTNSVYKTAAALGIGSTTAHRVLTKLGVERNGLNIYREKSGIYRDCATEMAADYAAGATYEELKAKYGHGSVWSIRSTIKKAGGELRDNPIPRVNEAEIAKIRELSANGMSQVNISLAIGRSQSFVGRVMSRNAIPTQDASGENSRQWKGGRWVDSNGYVRVWVSNDDPLASMRLSDNYIAEHRLVMARSLGRCLLRSETVHHINGDRTDNRIENLELRQGKHGKHIVMCCLECGSKNIGPVGLSATT